MLNPRIDPLLGHTLGDYKVERLIAKGGMGKVYEAIDSQLGRKIALKVITLEEERAEELMQRFRREAQAISKLDRHPNIVPVYRYGEQEGIHYLAMALIEGQSLAQYNDHLRRDGKRLPPEEMLHIFRQIAAALDHAHSHGVIHRDVKPANIMLEKNSDPTQPVKAILMDFGLVMQLDTSSTLGSAFGTPRYIAPEQAMASQQATAQSDIYSLGIVLYELLAGRPPFSDDETPMSVALSHITKPPPPLLSYRPDLPAGVAQAVMKAIEKRPEDRYQKAIDLVTALEAGFKGQPLPITPTAETPAPPPSNAPATTPLPSVVQAPLTNPSLSNRPSETQPSTPMPINTRQLSLMIGAVVVIMVILAGIGLILSSGGDDDQDGNGKGDGSPSAATPVASSDGAIDFYYSDLSLFIHNPGTTAVNLSDLELRANTQTFSLRDFGVRLENWQAGVCSYIALRNDGDAARRAAPDSCRSAQMLQPLLYDSRTNFVWRPASRNPTFEVYQNDKRLGTCTVNEAGYCRITGVARP